MPVFIYTIRAKLSVCVCVCVCVSIRKTSVDKVGQRGFNR